jgi:hypothetical protein
MFGWILSDAMPVPERGHAHTKQEEKKGQMLMLPQREEDEWMNTETKDLSSAVQLSRNEDK